MFKLVKTANNLSKKLVNIVQKRTFLSETYYCKDAWESRLNSPLLKQANPDVLYFELDQRYQKTRQLSVVDVDIFANSIQSHIFLDELSDIVHKLRLTAETGKTLPSTGHAFIRILLECNKTENLLSALDDRLNYGVFLDGFTANILLDHFWKNQDFVSGCRVASQLMLQEDFEHPIARALSILHCYNYLLKPGEWPIPPLPEEPEEEVKVRVKYVRNEYFDGHFDLREPLKIVAKTLIFATKTEKDDLNKSLNILGWSLFDSEKAKNLITNTKVFYKDLINLLPEEMKNLAENLDLKTDDINKLLQETVVDLVKKNSDQDIAKQQEIYKEWEKTRVNVLEEQKEKVLREKRLAEIKTLQQNLHEKELKLWFFENEENIELTIEENASKEAEKPITKTTKNKIEEDYIPPEIVKKYTQ